MSYSYNDLHPLKHKLPQSKSWDKQDSAVQNSSQRKPLVKPTISSNELVSPSLESHKSTTILPVYSPAPTTSSAHLATTREQYTLFSPLSPFHNANLSSPIAQHVPKRQRHSSQYDETPTSPLYQRQNGSAPPFHVPSTTHATLSPAYPSAPHSVTRHNPSFSLRNDPSQASVNDDNKFLTNHLDQSSSHPFTRLKSSEVDQAIQSLVVPTEQLSIVQQTHFLKSVATIHNSSINTTNPMNIDNNLANSTSLDNNQHVFDKQQNNDPSALVQLSRTIASLPLSHDEGTTHVNRNDTKMSTNTLGSKNNSISELPFLASPQYSSMMLSLEPQQQCGYQNQHLTQPFPSIHSHGNRHNFTPINFANPSPFNSLCVSTSKLTPMGTNGIMTSDLNTTTRLSCSGDLIALAEHPDHLHILTNSTQHVGDNGNRNETDDGKITHALKSQSTSTLFEHHHDISTPHDVIIPPLLNQQMSTTGADVLLDTNTHTGIESQHVVSHSSAISHIHNGNIAQSTSSSNLDTTSSFPANHFSFNNIPSTSLPTTLASPRFPNTRSSDPFTPRQPFHVFSPISHRLQQNQPFTPFVQTQFPQKVNLQPDMRANIQTPGQIPRQSDDLASQIFSLAHTPSQTHNNFNNPHHFSFTASPFSQASIQQSTQLFQVNQKGNSFPTQQQSLLHDTIDQSTMNEHGNKLIANRTSTLQQYPHNSTKSNSAWANSTSASINHSHSINQPLQNIYEDTPCNTDSYPTSFTNGHTANNHSVLSLPRDSSDNMFHANSKPMYAAHPHNESTDNQLLPAMQLPFTSSNLPFSDPTVPQQFGDTSRTQLVTTMHMGLGEKSTSSNLYPMYQDVAPQFFPSQQNLTSSSTSKAHGEQLEDQGSEREYDNDLSPQRVHQYHTRSRDGPALPTYTRKNRQPYNPNALEDTTDFTFLLKPESYQRLLDHGVIQPNNDHDDGSDGDNDNDEEDGEDQDMTTTSPATASNGYSFRSRETKRATTSSSSSSSYGKRSYNKQKIKLGADDLDLTQFDQVVRDPSTSRISRLVLGKLSISVNGAIALALGKFSCSSCQRKFSSKSGLELHERVHSKEQPYQCDHCRNRGIDKRFSQLSNLRRHLLTCASSSGRK